MWERPLRRDRMQQSRPGHGSPSHMYAAKNLRCPAIADASLWSMRAELTTLHGTIQRWRPHITTYFDTRLSTAMAEGFHTVVKLIKRISFGFRNVSRYRAKVMLGLGCAFTLKLSRT